MKLTLQTDYALRILMALAGGGEAVQSVDELSKRFKVSKNHLMKTSQALIAHGFVESLRGRNGGIKLAKSAGEINIADVVAAIEPDFHMAECFHKAGCSFLPSCRLRNLLGEARASFMQTLKAQTLSDMVGA
jgi:Rrf2 family transcriptional regulator, nitric oxide-sensitive transcriptional repressor